MKDLQVISTFSWRDLLRPGCLLGLAGIGVMAVAILRYAFSHAGADPGSDLEVLNSGRSVKFLVWLVVGVATTLFGALLSFIEFTRR